MFLHVSKARITASAEQNLDFIPMSSEIICSVEECKK